MSDYSASVIELAIHRALEARDFSAAVSLLHMLAVVDPRRAQAVLDVIELPKVLAQ